MRATHVYRLFSMDTGREYVYTILQFKVQIRLFHTKKMQIILYSNLEKSPIFKGKIKIKFHMNPIGKQKKERRNLQTFSRIAFVFSVSAWL